MRERLELEADADLDLALGVGEVAVGVLVVPNGALKFKQGEAAVQVTVPFEVVVVPDVEIM